jgi:hypothetical protein
MTLRIGQPRSAIRHEAAFEPNELRHLRIEKIGQEIGRGHVRKIGQKIGQKSDKKCTIQSFSIGYAE